MNYVLVHGGSVTGAVWDGVKRLLESRGHRVLAPTLSDERTSSLTDHIREVCGALAGDDLRSVALVGHSYGGMVITGAAASMPERLSSLCYIDAALPEPGQSLFDVIRSGGRDPLSFAGLDPFPPYVEPLRFEPSALKAIPKVYVRCTQSEFGVVSERAARMVQGEMKDGRWAYLELPTTHTPMRTMPEKVAELLLALPPSC